MTWKSATGRLLATTKQSKLSRSWRPLDCFAALAMTDRVDQLEESGRMAASEGANGPARDFLGYGDALPHARWPGDARIALNFNLNVEAGGEHSILEGDTHSENLLTDIGFPAYQGQRS